jgi:hypothetical protein
MSPLRPSGPKRTGIFAGIFAPHADVCADHIAHYKDAWEHMAGEPPGTYVVDVQPWKPPPSLPKGHHVKIATYYEGSLKVDHFPEYGFDIQCVTYAPESQIGNKVKLHLEPNQIVPLMNALKEAAIAERSKSLEA